MSVYDVLLVLVAIWIAELGFVAVLFAVAFVRSLREDPPSWWHPRLPDDVPDDFGPLRYRELPRGGDAEANSPR